jgi:hypothetical protein
MQPRFANTIPELIHAPCMDEPLCSTGRAIFATYQPGTGSIFNVALKERHRSAARPGPAEWLTGAALRGWQGEVGGRWGVGGVFPGAVRVVTVVQFAAGRCDAAGDRRPGRQSGQAASGHSASLSDLSEQAIDGLPQFHQRRVREPPQRRLAHKGEQQLIPGSHPYRGVCRIDLGAKHGQTERVLGSGA